MDEKESVFALITKVSPSPSSNVEADEVDGDDNKREGEEEEDEDEESEEKTRERYKSKYSGSIHPSAFPTFGVNGRRLAATFGKARNALKPDPKSFLQRSSSVKLTADDRARRPVIETIEDSAREKARIKAPIPSDRGQLRERVVIDRVKKNALDVILTEGNPQVMKTGDDRLFEEYNRNTRGKVPKYLQEIKKSIAHDNCVVTTPLTHDKELLTEEENGEEAVLRQQWLYLNAIYQKLPFVIDTPSKKARKEKCERKLDAIERRLVLSH
ncbi:unnamed protein product [Bathycoccus prasinos]